MKRILLIILVLNFSFYSSLIAQSAQDSIKSNITLRTFVENESTPLNSEVVYNVRLSWLGELSRYKISQVLDPDVTNLTLRGTGSSNKVTTNQDGSLESIKIITFYFKPVEMGMAYINGVTIRYEDTILEQKESLIASRIGVKIVDPLPTQSSSINLQNIFIYAILTLFGVGILYFLWQYRKKRKQTEIAELEEVIETIEQKYLRLLKETIHFSGNNIKEKIHDLTHLLSGFFSERYDYSLSKMSTADLINYLENEQLPPNLLEKIKEYFTKTDLVRFAGEPVTEPEFHQLYDSVEWIIEKHKTEKPMEENK